VMRLLRPPPSGIFQRSFPLHSPRYARDTIGRNLLAGAGCYARSARSQAVQGSSRELPVRRTRRTPRYGDH